MYIWLTIAWVGRDVVVTTAPIVRHLPALRQNVVGMGMRVERVVRSTSPQLLWLEPNVLRLATAARSITNPVTMRATLAYRCFS
jgi:hypothetical protein